MEGIKTLKRIACVKKWNQDLTVNEKVYWLQLSVINKGFSDQSLKMLQTNGFVIMPFSPHGYGYEVIVKARKVTKFEIPFEAIDTLSKADYLILANDFGRHKVSSRDEIQEAVKTCREYMRKYPPS